MTTIDVASINSAGIRRQAARLGLSEIEEIGSAGAGDGRVTLYRLGDVHVATTNGDPVWEEDDPAGFVAWLAEIGIDLD